MTEPDEASAAMPDVEVPEERPPAKHKGGAVRKINYVCSVCGRDVGRDNLVVKRVQFKEMGMGAAVIQTRRTGWVCRVPADDGGLSCLDMDVDFQLEPSHGRSPSGG